MQDWLPPKSWHIGAGLSWPQGNRRNYACCFKIYHNPGQWERQRDRRTVFPSSNAKPKTQAIGREPWSPCEEIENKSTPGAQPRSKQRPRRVVVSPLFNVLRRGHFRWGAQPEITHSEQVFRTKPDPSLR